MHCKKCKYYEKGVNDKPGTCTIPLANIFLEPGSIKDNGAGVSVENFDSNIHILYVGQHFGCKLFTLK